MRNNSIKIKRLIIEPNVIYSWVYAPIRKLISPVTKSRVSVVNDIWLEKNDVVNNDKIVLYEGHEFLLTADVINNQDKLQRLVKSYFLIVPDKKYPFNRNTLALFLQILAYQANDKNNTVLEQLKEWFSFNAKELEEELKKIDLKNTSDRLKESLKIFSNNLKYTESIIYFLQKIHGNAHKVDKLQAKFDANKTVIIPVSALQKKLTDKLLFTYSLLSNFDLVIDTDVDFDEIKDKLALSGSQSSIYISRYADDKATNYLASQAEEVWSSCQNSTQDVFLSWMAKKHILALKEYSTFDFQELLLKSQYSLYVARYFTGNDEDLLIYKYDDKHDNWESTKFDINYIADNTYKKKESNSVADDNIKKIEEYLVNLSVDLKKTKEDIYTKVLDQLNKEETKYNDVSLIENLSNQLAKFDSDLNELKEKVAAISKSDVIYRDDVDWNEANIGIDINKQFDEALNRESKIETDKNYSDFDD